MLLIRDWPLFCIIFQDRIISTTWWTLRILKRAKGLQRKWTGTMPRKKWPKQPVFKLVLEVDCPKVFPVFFLCFMFYLWTVILAYLCFWILEQQLAQEQVLELLPLVGEANAISEELDKHKYSALSLTFWEIFRYFLIIFHFFVIETLNLFSYLVQLKEI